MTDTISTLSGAILPTKSALKKHLKESPHDVVVVVDTLWESTSTPADQLPLGHTAYVVGPSAHDRRWYASITRSPKGLVLK